MQPESLATGASAPSTQIVPPTHVALRRIADSAQMIVWMTDADDRCIYLNNSAHALFNNLSEVTIASWYKFIHPDDAARIAPEFKKNREAHNEYQAEYRIVKSDGSIRWVLDTVAPRFTETGEFAGFNGSIVDVTKQHDVLERLIKSETEQRLLTENSGDLISHCAADGIYLYVSPSYTRALGRETSEIIGRNAYELIHPDDAVTVQNEVRRQIKEGDDSHVIEIRKRHPDGHYIWVGATVRVIFDPVSGEKKGTVSVSRDITLQRQAEIELRRSEERFRGLTQLSSDWYWETDRDDRFIFISDGMQISSGVDPKHVLGKSRAEIAIYPDPTDLATYKNRIANREPFRNLTIAVKVPVSHRVRYSSVSGKPVYEDGVFNGYRGVSSDITAEREVLQKLQHLANENKALIENSPDMMMLFDESGNILRANRAIERIVGYEPDEVVGRNYAEFVTSDTESATHAVVAKIRDGNGNVTDFENCWIRKDRSKVHLSWAIRRLADKNLYYATARDVTDRYLTRAELHHANQRLHSIVESIGDAFFSVDQSWHITYANRKAAAFVGVDHDAAIGKLIWEVVPDILASSVFPYYQRAMETGKNIFFESFYESVDAWVEVRAYPHEGGLSVFFHDITQRREAERLIRESEQRFREMIEITPAGYILTDAEGIVSEVNSAMCGMTGYSKEEFIGQDITQFLPSCPISEALKIQSGPSSAHGQETVIRLKAGTSAFVLANLSIRRDADGHALSLTAFVTDITERKQAEERLEKLATHDTLTGLPNRDLVNRRLQTMLDTTYADDSFAVMFIDLDRFKEVNDSMGHAPGDILLQQVATRLAKSMRPSDVVARLGGDEFVVAAYCSDGRKSAAVIADKLLHALTNPFEIEGQEVFVSASIGICMYAENARTKELLFQNADTAMYRAKAAGRNNYRFFESEMSVEMKRRVMLEHSLRHALERNEFELHYQPRVDLKTMQVVGVEALIRWNHPQLGRVPPLQFIPIAEDRGFIEAIGQ
jgi:diguanylate cyclase (GGDEF)-like protein/PAS domain S-box-containing protein